MSWSSAQRTRGYTLIEVLIAVAIFSALSLAAYSALDGMSKASRASQDHAQSLAGLQIMLQRMESDIQSLVVRPRFDQSVSSTADDFFGQASGFGGLRSGWENPLDLPRASLQRFQYRWVDGRLERMYWPSLYGGRDQTPQIETIGDEVEAVAFRYLSADGRWQPTWRPSPQAGLPRAVELSIEHQKFGSIRRLVVLQ